MMTNHLYIIHIFLDQAITLNQYWRIFRIYEFYADKSQKLSLVYFIKGYSLIQIKKKSSSKTSDIKLIFITRQIWSCSSIFHIQSTFFSPCVTLLVLLLVAVALS